MKVTYEIENGKKVKVKTYVDGTVYKFDEKGNWIYYKESDDYEQWREYDANGNEIHFKDSYDFEEWKEYDSISINMFSGSLNISNVPPCFYE